MAFTGDLEYLNIVDIIQLVHATKQSGVFSIKVSSGESRIVFSGGSIVGATHNDNSVRIGTVLVKLGAITVDDLKEALGVMKNADQDRMPLLATLVRMGKLKRDDALRGLKKLAELTIVELMGLHRGTFTFDTDTTVIATDGGQDLCVDAQMVLMDALRISDERERDRQEGKEVPSFVELYPDVLPDEGVVEAKAERAALTADDLGLGDLDRLEKRIPRPVADMEIFDPAAIRRRKIKELLPGFSSDEQEAFAAFLGSSLTHKSGADAAEKQAGKAVVLFSNDPLIGHSIMSLCNDSGVIVFATDDEKELDRMISQCLLSARMPVVVFDDPAKTDGGLSREQIAGMRDQVRGKYSAVPVLQFAAAQEADFMLQAYLAGVQAVLPKPSKDERKQTYIQDTIKFLEAFRAFVKGFQYGRDDADLYGRKLKEGILSLRSLANASDAALVVLTAVSEMFERAVTLVVRGTELIGERAIGIRTEKSMGPTAAGSLKIQLSKPSIFRDVIEKARVQYAESGDETLTAFFGEIGRPLSPAILLLPLICEQKVIAMIYADFGQKAAAPVRLEMLEILAQQAGMVLEHALFRRQMTKAAQQS